MAYKNPIPTLDDVTSPKSKHIDSNKDDYKEKKEVYFAFIDILGFKNMFSKKNNIVDEYKDVFNYYFELMDKVIFGNTGSYAGQTSDSLYFYTERPDRLLTFIKVFSYFNLYAMSKDVFFRGGIAKGNLYKREKHQFYGDSVIHAYLMESEIAKYPVIVIDENTNRDIQEDKEYRLMVSKFLNNRYYIKPFVILKEKFSLDIEEEIKREIKIEEIKQKIEKNKEIFEYDAKNYEKYVFLENELKKEEEECKENG